MSKYCISNTDHYMAFKLQGFLDFFVFAKLLLF